ncbi:unannotated protein [freshwater metagenome]|uniref:Unannotated protein n=1 Tax=freshwater metagenome TaxID=449393 RepID=A0A6J7NDX1_9ZZZZ|nr:DUF4244 domain-containing protein [Actinomycetota bacterium]MSV41742.1 DUF4244 domain-containing protein [Actinomycetota bacterium]MSV95509.1 DUF4244 domain-containing protein [Actinomycetota bacterium]MSY44540.1 DUF4244 domain-containing protein [Actinomycetota bacterium]
MSSVKYQIWLRWYKYFNSNFLNADRFVDDGQTTAEYALVILGAAAIATLLISWASGSGGITKLFDSVISKIIP